MFTTNIFYLLSILNLQTGEENPNYVLTYIPYLLSLLNLQTGEENLDNVHNLHSLSHVLIDSSDWRRGSRYLFQLKFPISCLY